MNGNGQGEGACIIMWQEAAVCYYDSSVFCVLGDAILVSEREALAPDTGVVTGVVSMVTATGPVVGTDSVGRVDSEAGVASFALCVGRLIGMGMKMFEAQCSLRYSPPFSS